MAAPRARTDRDADEEIPHCRRVWCQALHILKVAGGKLHEIESMGHALPYKSDAGW